MTKPIDWEIVDNMMKAGCNGVQCAAAIGVHPDTLYNKCKKEKKLDFSAYSQIKRSHGDGLLHAAQYQKAIKEKNPTMLIWLGKQRLNQREGNEALDPNGEALTILHDKIMSENKILELEKRLLKYESDGLKHFTEQKTNSSVL